ncbi:hypothetical protein V5O48_011338 [Marasmius crinis-equi]|uniref:WD40 repeat-like protein n=1 Tax=Marasmius crinis-equi TaxID=585013 RepID=A0ABR3F677_9AGAR
MSPPARAGDRGSTTAITFIVRPDDDTDVIATGSDLGALVLMKVDGDMLNEFHSTRLNGKDRPEIVSIAFDANTSQLLVAHRGGVMHLFLLDGWVLCTKKSFEIPYHSPHSVAFGQTTINGVDIWSYGREDGQIILLSEQGQEKETRSTESVLGHAVVSLKDDTIALDDTSQGIALYKLSTHTRVRTLQVPAKRDIRRSRNVGFVDGNNSVVSGSDHGVVYVFDRRGGTIVDELYIGVDDWVQAVVTTDVDGVPTIIAGQSGESVQEAMVMVWSKRLSGISARLSGMWLWGLFLVLVVLFVAQNIPLFPVNGTSWSRNGNGQRQSVRKNNQVFDRIEGEPVLKPVIYL